MAKITKKHLTSIAYKACDYLEIHEAYWPNVSIAVTKVPRDAELKKDYGMCWVHEERVYIWLNVNLCKKDNVSLVKTLFHEIAHTYLEDHLKLNIGKFKFEILSDALGKMLYDLWDAEVF